MTDELEERKKRKYICGGHWEWTDIGNEFDCDYEGAGEITCDECIINKEIGGHKIPKGMKWKMVIL